MLGVPFYLVEGKGRFLFVQVRSEEELNRVKRELESFGCSLVDARWEGEENWVEEVRRSFKPVKVGPLLIVPPWEEREGLCIKINPGRAFGTGRHESTKIALTLILYSPKGSFLDVGVGSGILSIAAFKLGFSPVVGIDIDMDACREARRNAEINGVPLYPVLVGSSPWPFKKPFDTVCANIYAETLIALKEELGRVAREGLVLSGILKGEEEKVLENFLGEFHLEKREEMGDWVGFLLRR